MAQQDWQKVKDIFVDAMQQKPEIRQEFLEDACKDDEEIRREVESLLSSYDEADSFMEVPAVVETGKTLIVENSQFTNGQSLRHYNIIEQIGKGGMGEVYLAKDTRLKRKVALKLLSTEFTDSKDLLRRFEQEAFAASSLNHPNILTIYEFGNTEDLNFIVTEFVDGKTLNEKLRDKHLMNLSEILDITIQTTSALVTAHEAGIIHRDIKPDNIMIRKDGIVKILDFGLAKLTERKIDEDTGLEATTFAKVKTTPGLVMGTPQYMSPEQASGKDIDERTDIWSLGVVFYEMIAGHLPFEGESIMEIIGSILKEEPKPLDGNEVPPEIKKIITKTLNKDKNDRYQNAEELLVVLKSVRQELELKNKLVRKTTPNKEDAKTQHLKTTTLDESEQKTTARNPKEPSIKKAKFNNPLLIGLAILIVSSFGFGYWYFIHRVEPTESIAVMPFVNMTNEKSGEYLSDGMTETLIGNLMKIPDLSVKNRDSVFYYYDKNIRDEERNSISLNSSSLKRINEKLNVKAVLFGRMVKKDQDDEIRLDLELKEAKERGGTLWKKTYLSNISDIVSLQKQITIDISRELGFKLSGKEQEKVTKIYTTNPKAYEAYLKGKFHINKGGDKKELTKGIELIKEATEIDPDYAVAWSYLADYYTEAYGYDISQKKELSKGRYAAEKAVEIAPELAEAQSALGRIKKFYYWDFSGAEKAFQTAIKLNPQYAGAHYDYSMLLANFGKFEESIKEAKVAYELNPFSIGISNNLGQKLIYARKYQEAVGHYKKALEIFPNSWITHHLLAFSLAFQGQITEAIAECEKAFKLMKGGNRYCFVRVYMQQHDFSKALSECKKAKEMGGSNRACFKEVYAKSGNRKEAYKIITEDLERSQNNEFHSAMTYALLGEKDKAFELLEKAVQKKDPLIFNIQTSFNFENLRGDPRYKELLIRIGFPE
ncbi:MAG: protein kinase [Pyrinomonadaceae bacterium]